MHKTHAAQILKDYNKLQEKVLEVNKKIYDSGIDRNYFEVYASTLDDVDKMEFDKDGVHISQTTYGWGGSVNYLSSYFPLEWLNLSDDDLLEQVRKQKQDMDEAKKQKEEEERKKKELEQERKEREEYEKLKAKYEYVQSNDNNIKMLEKIYGDAAHDKTATFQIPKK